jgi:hypothetical protein
LQFFFLKKESKIYEYYVLIFFYVFKGSQMHSFSIIIFIKKNVIHGYLSISAGMDYVTSGWANRPKNQTEQKKLNHN